MVRRIAVLPSSSAGCGGRLAGGQQRDLLILEADRARPRAAAPGEHVGEPRGPPDSPNSECSRECRRSASTMQMRRWKSCAIVSARLAAVRLLPSPRPGLVTRMTFTGAP